MLLEAVVAIASTVPGEVREAVAGKKRLNEITVGSDRANLKDARSRLYRRKIAIRVRAQQYPSETSGCR